MLCVQHWSCHFVNVTKYQILSRPGSGLPKFYYKLRRLCLLQITRRSVVTNYYKLRESSYKLWQVQLYYSRRQHYNKLRQLLQIMSEQTCYIFSVMFWKPDISFDLHSLLILIRIIFKFHGDNKGRCYWMFTLYFNSIPINFWIFCLVCDCLPFWVIFELWFISEQDAKIGEKFDSLFLAFTHVKILLAHPSRKLNSWKRYIHDCIQHLFLAVCKEGLQNQIKSELNVWG